MTILDMRHLVSFCDFFVIASASSNRQVRAIGEAIIDDLEKIGVRTRSRIPVDDESGWVALDYSGVIAHVFYRPLREHYDLERLWADAPRSELGPWAALASPSPG